MNRFVNTILLVRDLGAARDFYAEVLGLPVEREFETVVFFRDHFVLHQAGALLRNAYGEMPPDEGSLGRDNLEVYLESDDLDASFAEVRASGASIVHGIVRQPWGQKVFRFQDPDGHLVEIGERTDESSAE